MTFEDIYTNEFDELEEEEEILDEEEELSDEDYDEIFYDHWMDLDREVRNELETII